MKHFIFISLLLLTIIPSQVKAEQFSWESSVFDSLDPHIFGRPTWTLDDEEIFQLYHLTHEMDGGFRAISGHIGSDWRRLQHIMFKKIASESTTEAELETAMDIFIAIDAYLYGNPLELYWDYLSVDDN